MLEVPISEATRLKTWRIAGWPVGAEPVKAEQVADHRAIYLDYEGPISRGRGTVSQVDTGLLLWVEREVDRFEAHLNGRRIQAAIVLKRCAPAGNPREADVENDQWQLFSRPLHADDRRYPAAAEY